MMESILYNGLVGRGFDVDIGVVEYNCRDEDKKSKRVQLEIDFVANKGGSRYHIGVLWHPAFITDFSPMDFPMAYS